MGVGNCEEEKGTKEKKKMSLENLIIRWDESGRLGAAGVAW